MQRHKISIFRNQGFFSDFLTAMAGVLYCYEQGHEPYVNWISERYSDDFSNLFDLYFHQDTKDEGVFDVVHKNLTPYGYVLGLPLEWYQQSDREISYALTRMARVFQVYRTFDSPFIRNVEMEYVNRFGTQRVLGFHKRDTDVGDLGVNFPVVSDEDWVRCLRSKMKQGQYDRLFCITDNELSLAHFKKEFGSLLVHTRAYRSPTRQAFHYGGGRPKGEVGQRLAEDVLRDMVMLSMTDFLVLSRSNVSVVALLKAMQDLTFSDKQFHFLYREEDLVRNRKETT